MRLIDAMVENKFVHDAMQVSLGDFSSKISCFFFVIEEWRKKVDMHYIFDIIPK
jgi:hypothetical protein